MTIAESRNKKLPENYYPTMYLDGFTPEEILTTARKGFIRDAEGLQEESYENVHITSEVKIEK